jgi:hypothetical protein
MPIGEIEEHPYLELGYTPGATRLILGSFPVYECTNPDNDLKTNRRIDGTVRFFYGSNRNRLWRLYSEYIDREILPPWEPDTIVESLTIRNIAVSDLITSCERYKSKTNRKTGRSTIDHFSSEDDALHNRTYNVEQIRTMITEGVTKILCTSKAVLKWLESKVILKEEFGVLQSNESDLFQNNFINEIEGNPQQITHPTHRCFLIDNQIIEAIAIPSPGSPHRRLNHFGFAVGQRSFYANAYFRKAFVWLAE